MVICVHRIVTEAMSNTSKYIQNLVIRIIYFREIMPFVSFVDGWLLKYTLMYSAILKYILITRQ